ncbi:glycosyltransferase family 2 protein [Patescibacteria group bacterium]|nr:glycosyltransferase family 2 protein [Patescibacteria group bacterium]
MTVSVIIPIFNEEEVIGNCLASLAKQTIPLEIIVVDDGSTDGSVKYATYKQSHKGPGAARNFGASKAKGDILVFVDADMEFAPDFVEKLIAPIVSGKAIGTYSEDEYLLNKDKPLARYWNLNFGRSVDKMDPRGYAAKATGLYKFGKTLLEKLEGEKADEERNKVFRAILREKFLSMGGFDTNVGYTDDWTIAEKLNAYPVAAKGAVYYHRSPDTLPEIWKQARWFGKNEFLTKNIIRRIYNLFRYCPFWAVLKLPDWQFFIFKLVFNGAVETSVLLSFFGEKKYK